MPSTRHVLSVLVNFGLTMIFMSLVCTALTHPSTEPQEQVGMRWVFQFITHVIIYYVGLVDGTQKGE